MVINFLVTLVTEVKKTLTNAKTFRLGQDLSFDWQQKLPASFDSPDELFIHIRPLGKIQLDFHPFIL